MAADTPGWYGKLAMLGDFASRRLDSAVVQICDRWLSAGLLASRQALGERWASIYLAAPVWRFAWAPGVVDGRWWFGVLMPSCDCVGRYYPLLIAQPRAHPACDRIALNHLELWWAHIARAGLATLADDARLQAFETALEEAPPWPSAAPAALLRASATPEREHYGLAAGAALSDLAFALAAEHLRQRLAGASIWTPLLAPGAPEHCSVVQGLPAAQAFAEMLVRES